MRKTVEVFREQVFNLWLCNSTVGPGYVENLRYQGALVKHVATVGKSPAGITVYPFDPSILGGLVAYLQSVKLNAYMASKSHVVVTIPKNKDEDRIIAQTKKLAEEARVAVRNLRRTVRQGLTKDELKVLDRELQKETDDTINTIDDIVRRSQGG